MPTLLTSRRFAPLFWCQFFAAFNDNFLKNALVALIVYASATSHPNMLIQFAGAIFIAPYFLLSGLAGEMADRFDKAVVARRLKLAEILASAFAALGFAMHSIGSMMVSLALFGILGALFGPVKYGILPDYLAAPELPAGNALIEGATFVAILAGTIIGSKAAVSVADPWLVSGAILIVAFACWGAAALMPRVGAKAPHLRVDANILASTRNLIATLRQDRRLWTGTLIVNWFWAFGAVMLSLLPTLTARRFGGDEDVYICLLALFSVAVAVGSGFAAWLAHGRILLLPTPIAGLAMSAFAIDLGISSLGVWAWGVWPSGASPASVAVAHGLAAGGAVGPSVFFSTWRGCRAALDLFGMAAAGGVFVVPLFAAIQSWAGEDRRARTVAAGNVVSAAYMVVAALAAAALQAAGIDEGRVLVVLGLCGLVIAWIAWRALRFEPSDPRGGLRNRPAAALPLAGREAMR